MSRGRIARWMLEEVGQDYDTVILPFGQHKTAEYLTINPMGKVPTLRHGDNIVTECAAICLYLAEAFPQSQLIAKAGSRAHANALRWLFFAAGPLEAAVVNKALGVEIPNEKKGMVGYGNFDDTITTLDAAISDTEYIAGSEFSAADVYVGSQIGLGLQFKSIPALPSFVSYWDRIAKRPAHIKASALDDAAMAELKK